MKIFFYPAMKVLSNLKQRELNPNNRWLHSSKYAFLRSNMDVFEACYCHSWSLFVQKSVLAVNMLTEFAGQLP